MALNLEKTNAIITAVKYFLENRDTFTLDNILKELRENDTIYYDGNIDDDQEEIEKVVDNLITTLYPEYRIANRKAYFFDYDYDLDIENDYNDYQEIELEDDDYEVDKEGNRIPYDSEAVAEEEEKRGPGWYKDPATGQWEWDRDAAASAEYEEEWYNDNKGDNNMEEDKEFHDLDHPVTFELTVDKNKRVNIKKAVFEEAKFAEDEPVIIIANETDKTCFYILKQSDSNCFALNDDEFIVGEYTLKKGALRLGVGSIIDGIKAGDKLTATVNWEDPDCVYIEVSFDM